MPWQIRPAECPARQCTLWPCGWSIRPQAVKIPIIGMGGISTAEDAIEMLLAGATAVAVGTANFHNPSAAADVVDGIAAYMKQYGIEDVRELIGGVR